MKKIILVAAALALGGAAYAQDTSTQPPATTPDASAPATPDASMPAATPDASTPPATPDASMPAPTTGAGDTSTGTAPTATQGSADLPTCSKTVTDNCKQGGKASSSHHRVMHHKKK